jgi:hypothetical protein
VRRLLPGILLAAVILLIAYLFFKEREPATSAAGPPATKPANTPGLNRTFTAEEKWLERAFLVNAQFQRVYTPCWEGAYGAFGAARLFSVTGDTGLLRFHTITTDLTRMCTGTWLDDRAWVCLAEIEWWKLTGRTRSRLISDAARRYDEAVAEGRLSSHQGYWSWYNWPPRARVNEPIFTNSNMNQMIAVGCGLYEATGNRKYLDDALLVWNGDGTIPGVEARLYRGDGRWEGAPGRAAFGKELPWGGLSYASIGATPFRATGEKKYRDIAVATVRRLLDPATGWVDDGSYYQLHMDGNGNFVQFLLDAYLAAPEELNDVPAKVEKMLEHVWSNAGGTARILLHRTYDHGIRNGWNPMGGEDGYGVDEVGTVHAQGEAMKAFGYFAEVEHRLRTESR